MRHSFFISLVFLLSGCFAPLSKQPMGDTPIPVLSEQWDGIWLLNGLEITAEVIDENEGTISISFIDDSGDEPYLAEYTVYLKNWESWGMANAQLKGTDVYIWALIVADLDNGIIIAYEPNNDLVEQLIYDKELPGNVESGSNGFCCGGFEKATLELLNNHELGVLKSYNNNLFDIERPYIFIRKE
jgi:hypothetical protein